MATISRLLKIIGRFGEYRSLLQGSFAIETYDFKELTNPSHPIFLLSLRTLEPFLPCFGAL